MSLLPKIDIEVPEKLIQHTVFLSLLSLGITTYTMQLKWELTDICTEMIILKLHRYSITNNRFYEYF